MTTLLAFIVTLGLLVIVHEWGHYRMARACGVKVLRFSIGLGRPLWRRQRGETEWVIGLLPLGGYVKMLDEREGQVPSHELARAFNRRPLGQRAAIVAAGPAANLILAVLLYAASLWVGTDEPRALLASPPAESLAERAGLQAGDHVVGMALLPADAPAAAAEEVPVASLTDLRWQLTRAALAGQDVILHVARSAPRRSIEAAPAAAAAFPADAGEPADPAAAKPAAPAAEPGRTAPASVNADPADRSPVATVVVRLPLAALGASDADAALTRRIGIGAPFSEPVMGKVMAGGAAEQAGLQRGDRVLSVDERVPPDAAALRQWIRSAATAEREAVPQRWRVLRGEHVVELAVRPARVQDRGQTIGRIEAAIGAPPVMDFVRLGPWDGLVRGLQRTVETSVVSLKLFGRMLIGEASLRNLSGPLTIADYAGQSVQLGLAYYLGFLALVSISLGVLNLLPFPMLDGGHLLYYAIEAITGRPLPDAWLEWLQRGGLVLIVAMMSLALFNDVARLAGLQ